jgi:DNA-binding NarL/FixJ family response regulator
VAALIRVAVIDNDEWALTLPSGQIEQTPGLELVYCGSAVEEYLASDVRADVVLLDLMMEDGSSPAANVTRICESGARVLVVSTHGEPLFVRAAMRAGASGYLLKAGSASTLADAIRTVHAGNRALTQELAFVINLKPPSLTERQLQVLYLFGTGSTLEGIAARLQVSVATVREHLARTFAKFAAAGDPISTRADAAGRLPDYEVPGGSNNTPDHLARP